MWGKGRLGGYYIPVGSVYLKNSEPFVPGIINRIKYGYGRTYLLTQQTHWKRAGKERKTKNPGINPGQPAKKGREKKKKKKKKKP
jgi:hypothetical protein